MTPEIVAAERTREVRDAALAWRRAGFVSEGALSRVLSLYPDDRQRFGPGFRLLAFLFAGFACLVLVGLIAFIVVRALISAQGQSSLFARLAASTLAIQFGLQSGINLSVNLNLIPPKGMTLPFVSYGGTSMVAIAFGMSGRRSLSSRNSGEAG